jgi:spermidine/putrescine-binding protein
MRLRRALRHDRHAAWLQRQHDSPNSDLPTDTWALIFEPRYLEKLKGKVTVLNSQRELMAAAMKYLGYSVQETDPSALGRRPSG